MVDAYFFMHFHHDYLLLYLVLYIEVSSSTSRPCFASVSISTKWVSSNSSRINTVWFKINSTVLTTFLWWTVELSIVEPIETNRLDK